MFIYSCFARQISFQSDEFRTENEYKNIHPPINVLFLAVINRHPMSLRHLLMKARLPGHKSSRVVIIAKMYCLCILIAYF